MRKNALKDDSDPEKTPLDRKVSGLVAKYKKELESRECKPPKTTDNEDVDSKS